MSSTNINLTGYNSSFNYTTVESAVIHSQRKSLKDHIKKSLLKK